MVEFTADGIKDFNSRIVAEFRANGGRSDRRSRTRRSCCCTTGASRVGRGSPLAYHRRRHDRDRGLEGGADTNPDWVPQPAGKPRAHIGSAPTLYDVLAREMPSTNDEMPENRREGAWVRGIPGKRRIALFHYSNCSASDLRSVEIGLEMPGPQLNWGLSL